MTKPVKAVQMKFLREISVNNINDVVINNLEQEGFTLVWKDSSIEIWYETIEEVSLQSSKAA